MTGTDPRAPPFPAVLTLTHRKKLSGNLSFLQVLAQLWKHVTGRETIVTRQDGPVEEGEVFKQPGVVEVADGKVTLHQEHVLEQRAGGVTPIGHSLIEGAICHILQEDHGLLHDG